MPMMPTSRPSPMAPAVKIRVVKSTRTVEVKKMEILLRCGAVGMEVAGIAYWLPPFAARRMEHPTNRLQQARGTRRTSFVGLHDCVTITIHVASLTSNYPNSGGSGAAGAGYAGQQRHLLRDDGRGVDCGDQPGTHGCGSTAHRGRGAEPQSVLFCASDAEPGRRNPDRRPLRCATCRQRH